MTCGDVARLLDGDLLPEEAGGEERLREHARGCAVCRPALEQFLSDEALLRRHFARAAPRRRGRRLAAAAVAVAACVTAIVGGVALWHSDETSRGAPATTRLVTTTAGTTTDLELEDGSRVRVEPETSLRVGPGRRLGVAAFLERGRIRCVVRPDDAPFRIGTPSGEAVATGTEFEVSFTPVLDDATPTHANGVSVMTHTGGVPKAAVLTIAVVTGLGEFRHGGRVAGVRAQEMLVATGDDAPRVVPMTGAGRPVEVPAFHPGSVHIVQRMVSALTLAPDGQHLAICVRQLAAGAIGENNPPFVGIDLWNVAKDRLESFVALDGSPSDATFTSDGRLWATEAMNNELRRVDAGAGGVAETLDLNLPPNVLTSDDARLYPSPDGKRVVVTGFNTSKTLYRYPGWQRETVLEGPVDCLPCEGAWSADSGAFVAGSRDHALRVWSFAGAAGARARAAGSGLAPVFGPDGKVWAITTDATAFGPSEAEGDARRAFVDDAAPSAGFFVARFSHGGQRLALGREDGVVVLFDVASRKALRTIDYHAPDDVDPNVGSLLWAPDDAWLAIGRYDGSSCIVRFPAR
jgi:hypothetical protein